MEYLMMLFLSGDSPFSNAKVYNVLNMFQNVGVVWSETLMNFCKTLANILTSLEGFANECYNFLSFSNNSTFTSLYDVINKYLMIPIAIVLIIVAIKFAFGDVDRRTSKQLLKNLGIVFLMIGVMPSIFSFMNNVVIGKDFMKSVAPNSSENIMVFGDSDDNSEGTKTIETTQTTNTSTADMILKSNTTDFVYLYEHSPRLKAAFGGEQLPARPTDSEMKETIEELKKLNTEFVNSDEAKVVSFSSGGFNFHQQILSENDDLTGVPTLFQYKVETTNPSVRVESENPEGDVEYHQHFTKKLSEGILFGLGRESYGRYHIDFLNTIIQLFATTLMYFCVGYSVLKLIFELLIHQLFGPVMAAMDLTGGQRIKKYVSSIIGCYMGLLISSIIITLYGYACNFISNTLHISGLPKSIMMIALAIIFLDGPNIIARYFGVNTGIRGGMAMAGLAMMKASRIATAPARVASSVGTAALNNKVRDGMNAPRMRQQESQRRAETSQREAQRQAENSQREARRQAEMQNRQQKEYDAKMDNYRDKYGTNGDFEKYEKPLEYDPNLEGSEQNRAAVLQQAGYDAIEFDRTGKKNDFETSINSAGDKVGATQTDINNALNSNPAEKRDAQHGIYSGVANKAEQFGGTREAYVDSAKKSLGANASNTDLVNYTADASYNAKHASQTRTVAKNIQATSMEHISDVDAYKQAMDKTAGRYKYTNDANKERIAKIEINENGSLREGSRYDNRPSMRDGSRPKSAI